MKRRRYKRRPIFYYIVVLIGLFLMGYLSFRLFILAPTNKKDGSGLLWNRLKERLFDQDLPVPVEGTPTATDMNDISTNSPSPGLSPTRIIQEVREPYSKKDRNQLDAVLKENDE